MFGEFGLMVGGDEFCLRLGESGGVFWRTVSCNVSLVTNRTICGDVGQKSHSFEWKIDVSVVNGC